MSYYIFKENQEMLWNILHTVPMIQGISQEIKETLFKSIIKKNNELKPIIDNYNDLLEINRNTLLEFIYNVNPNQSQDNLKKEMDKLPQDNFKKEMDKPIQNMEELVKLHLLERENEFKKT